MSPRRSAAGFTLTEMMVALAIVAVLSTLATPYFGRSRAAREGREFASELARDLQMARGQAISERLPMYAFVYSDRVEFRSALPGATPGSAPTAPTTADPMLRVLIAKTNVSIFDMLPNATTPPGAAVLGTSTPVQLQFNTFGQVQFLGQPAMTGAFIYVRNAGVGVGHPESSFRVDVTPLTGFVTLRKFWI